MNEGTELEKLANLLRSEPPEKVITFREESARDIRYTLVVGSDDPVLLIKLAWLFGCPEKRIFQLENRFFEAGDDWHGRGQVDLRELADEFLPVRGQFFDFDITIAELRSLAWRKAEHECERSLAHQAVQEAR
jgi:hypothetical protein